MKHRWIIWTGGIFAIAALALLPLQVVLKGSDIERMGFTARQVAGTIWYGRIGELHLRTQKLGTFNVTTDVLPLLIGNVVLRFDRLESLEGPLRGQLVAGGKRGVVDLNGRVAVGGMFSPLPISAFELDRVTVLFADGRCQRASGRLRPIIAAAISGMSFDANTAGSIVCDGERARVRMRSATGRERIEFYVAQSGRYRAWITAAGRDGVGAAPLTLLGFRPGPEGMTLTVDGQW